MGARYAPSIANIFLNKLEEEQIFTNHWPQLKMYRCYINDIFVIWEGPQWKMEEFLAYINSNEYNIKCTSIWHESLIQFLDLEIYRSGTQLGTHTHFKDTDRNGYISTWSCHHLNCVIPMNHKKLR